MLDDGSTDGTADLVRAGGRSTGPAAHGRAAAGRLARQAARLPPARRGGDRRRRPRVRRRRRGARARTRWRPRSPRWTAFDLLTPYPRIVAHRARAAAGAAAAAVVVADVPAAAGDGALAAAVAGGGRRAVPRGAAGRRTTAAGGHAAVRDKVLEDVELARAVKRAGGRIALADGSALATCRMYGVVARAGRRVHQVAVGVVRLAARRASASSSCCSVVYVAARCWRRWPAGWCRRCSALAGAVGLRRRGRRPGRRRPGHRRPGLARRARPPAVGAAVRVAGRAVVPAAPGRMTWKGRPVGGGMSRIVVVIGAGVGGLADARRGSPRPGTGSPCSSGPPRSAASWAGSWCHAGRRRSGSTPGRA